MRTEHLAYLQEIVRTGSINKASQTLHISQQQLSKIVRQLEDEFGTAIFLRHQGGTILTADGQLIMQHVDVILDDIASLVHTFKDQPNQTSAVEDIYYHSISCINLERTTSIFHAFSQQYPIFALHVDEKPASEIFALLKQHCDHVGSLTLFTDLCYLNPVIPKELQFIPVFTSSFVVYAAQNHPLAQKVKSVSLHSLLQEPLVIYNPHPHQHTIIHDLLSLAGEPQNISTVSNLSAFFSMLKKGKHLAIGLRQFRQPIQNDAASLTCLPIREKTSVVCGLVIRRDIESTHFIHTFVNFYKDQFHQTET